jgi:pimeloyl-ACP methyl ester carboxylesterase
MGQTEAANHFDMRGCLGGISIPCQIVHGKEDEVVSVERATDLQSEMPKAKLTLLENVGHFPQLEDPENLSFAIRRVGCQVTGY